jgi:aminopeptidase N
VEKKILKNKKSVVLQNLGKVENMEDKIEAIFYTILNRKPDSREERDSKDFVKKFGDDAYPDLIWTLVNSHEFIFVQ